MTSQTASSFTRSPTAVAALVVVTGMASAIHLGVSTEPFDASSSLVIALGIVVFTLVTCAGLLLARGRWSRRLGVVAVVSELALVAVLPFGPWAVVAAVAGVGAVVGLLGRWLDGWIRPRPSAIGPSGESVVLMLGLLAFIPAVGLASPGGLENSHGLLGAAAVLLAWSYARAHVWAVWAIRLVLAPLAVPAVLASPTAGAIGLAALTIAVVAVSWSPEIVRSVDSLPDNLPTPRRPKPESTSAPDPDHRVPEG